MQPPVPARRGPRFRLAPPLALALPLAALVETTACTGSVADPMDDDAPASVGKDGAGGKTAGPGKVDVGSPGKSGSGSGGAPLGSCAVRPGPAPLRRLTNVEYQNTLRDLLGTPPPVLAGLELPENVHPGLFDRNADAQRLSYQGLGEYARAAEKVATELVGATDRRAKVVGCDPAGAARAACTESFLRTFGKRALRGPVPAETVAALSKLAAAEPDGWAGIGVALEALLQAPGFLFRAELGAGAPDARGLVRLRGPELAARLSYLLWETTPSDELLAAAEAGTLDTPEGTEATARKMLADPRARTALRRFVGQWLSLDRLQHVKRDPKLYPGWNEGLRSAMEEETLRFVEDLIWTEKRSLAEVFTGKHTFVNAPIAKIYGVPAPAGAEWKRVELPPDAPRAGILTQPAFLAITGRDQGTSAIIRGKWVRESLLCETLPAPPPNIPEIPESRPGESERSRLARHREDVSCAPCHALLDPVGFGLEQYDAVGAFRTKDASGNPLTGEGELAGFASPAFKGGPGLAQKIAAAPQARGCMAERILEYALGRSPTEQDECLKAQLAARFTASGEDLRETLVWFVRSDAFRTRTAHP